MEINIQFDLEHQQRIAEVFAEAMEKVGCKPGSKEYNNREAAYYCGAIAALNYAPRAWTLCMCSGRSITELILSVSPHEPKDQNSDD